MNERMEPVKCSLCHLEEQCSTGPTALLGPFISLWIGGSEMFVHRECAIWSPEVYEDADDSLQGCMAAVSRGRQIRCSHCGERGATIGCRLASCSLSYHLPCAVRSGCRLNSEKFLIACPSHSSRYRGESTIEDHLQEHQNADEEREEIRGRQRGHVLFWSRPDSNLNRPSRTASRMNIIRARVREAREAVQHAIREQKRAFSHDQPSNPHDLHDEDEAEFREKEEIRYRRDVLALNPIVLGGPDHAGSGSSTAGFESVGGQAEAVQRLKEMVLLPLLYPELARGDGGFLNPGGILLHGPPGTGKTLLVRSVAEECARSAPVPVTLFARKGADCLGKYAGDAERTLRLIFDEAKKKAPSIVFLDEIDALVPCRSVRGGTSDQIYASIVSTLLSLMDGVSSRGHVVVIGSTNRPDCIDSALRRPGRFDREILVGLPSLEDRISILSVHTRHWPQLPPRDRILRKVAAFTEGYAGADLAALCASAVVCAAKRTYHESTTSGMRHKTNQPCELTMDLEELGLIRSGLKDRSNQEANQSEHNDLDVQQVSKSTKQAVEDDKQAKEPALASPAFVQTKQRDLMESTEKIKEGGANNGSFFNALLGFASLFKRQPSKASASAHVTVEDETILPIPISLGPPKLDEIPAEPLPPTSPTPVLSLNWIPKVHVQSKDWNCALSLAPTPSSLREPLSVLCPSLSFSSLKVNRPDALKCLPVLFKSITLLKRSFHATVVSSGFPPKLAYIMDAVEENDTSYLKLADALLDLGLILGEEEMRPVVKSLSVDLDVSAMDADHFDAQVPALNAPTFTACRILLHSANCTLPTAPTYKPSNPRTLSTSCTLLLALMEGAQVVTFNLAQMIFRGQGDISKGFLEALQGLPSCSSSLLVLYFPDFDSWVSSSKEDKSVSEKATKVKVNRKALQSASNPDEGGPAISNGVVLELEYGTRDSFVSLVSHDLETSDLWSVLRQGLESRLSPQQPVIILATTQKPLSRIPSHISSFFQLALGTEGAIPSQLGLEIEKRPGKRRRVSKPSQSKGMAVDNVVSNNLERSTDFDFEDKEKRSKINEIEEMAIMFVAGSFVSPPLHHLSVSSDIEKIVISALRTRGKLPGGYEAFKSQILMHLSNQISARSHPKRSHPLSAEARQSISKITMMMDICQQAFFTAEMGMESEALRIVGGKRTELKRTME